MRSLRKSVLLLALVVCLCIASALRAIRADVPTEPAPHLPEPSPVSASLPSDRLSAQQTTIPPVPTSHLENGPFIDGAVNPELIPDEIAYLNFFRMLSRTADGADAEFHQKSYIRHVLRRSGPPSDSDIASLQRFAASYQTRLRELGGGQASAAAKANMARSIASTMRMFMSPRAAAAIDTYVLNDFKKRTKIIYKAQ